VDVNHAPQFGRGARKTIVRGDIVASFQYLPVLDERRQATGEREPGVIIMRALDVPKANRKEPVPKIIIGLSAAWKYGVDSYAAGKAREYATFLFGDASSFTVHRLHDFLNDMLIELVTMKPERPDEQGPAPQLSIRDDGSFHVDVTEPELH